MIHLIQFQHDQFQNENKSYTPSTISEFRTDNYVDRNIITHVYTIIPGTQYILFVIELNCVSKKAPVKQRYAVPPPVSNSLTLKSVTVFMQCAHKMFKGHQKDTCTASPHCFKRFFMCERRCIFHCFSAGQSVVFGIALLHV